MRRNINQKHSQHSSPVQLAYVSDRIFEAKVIRIPDQMPEKRIRSIALRPNGRLVIDTERRFLPVCQEQQCSQMISAPEGCRTSFTDSARAPAASGTD